METMTQSLGLRIHVYLLMNRLDLARKEIQVLKAKADDSALAQLIEAWVDLFTVRFYLCYIY
jgi:hypothetical protein